MIVEVVVVAVVVAVAVVVVMVVDPRSTVTNVDARVPTTAINNK